jgi:hypothetical protein
MDNAPNQPEPRLVREDDRRVALRQPMDALQCDRGEILDLSKTGARLRTRWAWREGRTRPLTIIANEFVVNLHARCVWSVKDGFLKHTIGLHFEDITPAKQEKLAQIAQQFAVRELSDGYREAA